MNTAKKGRRREHEAREWLEAAGYVVTRSAASKGAWDLVGISAQGVALAQVKSNCWPGPEERAALESFLAPIGTERLMFRFDDRKDGRIRRWDDGAWVELPEPFAVPASPRARV